MIKCEQGTCLSFKHTEIQVRVTETCPRPKSFVTEALAWFPLHGNRVKGSQGCRVGDEKGRAFQSMVGVLKKHGTAPKVRQSDLSTAKTHFQD